MKTTLLLLATALAASMLLSSCGHTTPVPSMTTAQRQAYVEHRRWDYEAEMRKEIDTENRR